MTFGPWRPLTLDEATALFRGAPFPWWVSGGHALDLHLGESWRDHDDMDISFRRSDADALHRHLDGWDIHVAAAGVLSPWRGDALRMDQHQNNLWARRTPVDAWSLDLTVGDGNDVEWIYRRTPTIRTGWREAVLRTKQGIPYLAPEWQLLFKSVNPRPKDDVDAEHVMPQLSPERLDRLVAVLDASHPWLRFT